jgi:hypothetical protein
MPKSREIEKVVKEIARGGYEGELKNLAEMELDELKKLYEEREIE